MKKWRNTISLTIVFIMAIACNQNPANTNQMEESRNLSAEDILGNPSYLAISYGGYRQPTRDVQPSVDQLKNDMKTLHAMGIRILRTYNVQLPHASNVLKAIKALKAEDEQFEMYVMLGAWIDCKNAWTDKAPDHDVESAQNAGEIKRAVALAQKYPDIVKVIAVGNEAMVKWAAAYYVQPSVILKWVKHLQGLKESGELPKDLWITSSDNFASWGGGDQLYHVPDLNELIHTVDYISVHTYPMHDTHYNPQFWGVTEEERKLPKKVQIDTAMRRSLAYAQNQYNSVVSYMESLGVNKPIHIGETGWASTDNHLYGAEGSKATDEYKQDIYHQLMRDWTNEAGISCFYFEAFDEPWKDANNKGGSENHFGLFTVDGQAKYAIWELVDQGIFDGLTRNGNLIKKTHGGDFEVVFANSPLPPVLPSVENVTP